MLNILVVIGTRPEAIKLSPIVLELQKHSDKIYVEICITAQHRSLLDDVLVNIKITSDHDLDLMSYNQTLEEISIRDDEIFKEMGGGSLELVPSLNSSDDWVKGFAEFLKKNS